MKRAKKNIVFASLTLTLGGCSADKPVSMDEVIAQQREELTQEGQVIVWLRAEPGEEPNSYTVIADRKLVGKPETEETLICSITQTSGKTARSCTKAAPSILNRARIGLYENYRSRDIDVREVTLTRTSEGNRFAGRIVLVDPAGGPDIVLPCRGDQDGENYTADCKAQWIADETAKQDAQTATEDEPAPIAAD